MASLFKRMNIRHIT